MVEKYLPYMKRNSLMLQQRTISTRSSAICRICSNRIRDVHLFFFFFFESILVRLRHETLCSTLTIVINIRFLLLFRQVFALEMFSPLTLVSSTLCPSWCVSVWALSKSRLGSSSRFGGRWSHSPTAVMRMCRGCAPYGIGRAPWDCPRNDIGEVTLTCEEWETLAN